MNTSPAQDVLAEVWVIKDSLSARCGHSLEATCRAIYAEQQKHLSDFVNLGAAPRQTETAETTGGASKSPVARKRRVRPNRVSA
jgi:hypothetical protein